MREREGLPELRAHASRRQPVAVLQSVRVSGGASGADSDAGIIADGPRRPSGARTAVQWRDDQMWVSNQSRTSSGCSPKCCSPGNEDPSLRSRRASCLRRRCCRRSPERRTEAWLSRAATASSRSGLPCLPYSGPHEVSASRSDSTTRSSAPAGASQRRDGDSPRRARGTAGRLTLVYISDFFASLFVQVPPRPALGEPGAASAPPPRPEPTALSERGERALGFFHLGTGLWLIYLTFAAVLNIASGMDLPLWAHAPPHRREQSKHARRRSARE